MKRAKLSDAVQADDAFFDLVLGTLNQVYKLANKTADHIAAEQERVGRQFTVNEAAQALIDHKLSNVSNLFKSSPNAQKGIQNRYKAEKTAFKQFPIEKVLGWGHYMKHAPIIYPKEYIQHAFIAD